MNTKIITGLALMLINLHLLAVTSTDVTSHITNVTVFLNGAQVDREARVNLTKGTSTLAFRDLPVNIDPQSIQARGEGNFIILSLLHQVNYLAGARQNTAVQALQDTLKRLEDRLAQADGRASVLTGEEELLKANRSLGGGDRTITVAELKLAADFYRSRLTEIRKEQIKLKSESTLLTTKIEKVKNQLNTLNADLNKPTSEILVNISVPDNTGGTLWISYTVTDAGWFPVYDIRAKDIRNPVNLYYNARVFQHTGEDWNKVSLRLTTANPQQRGEKPVLYPWYLDFERPPVLIRASGLKMAQTSAPMAVEEKSQDNAESAAAFTQVTENQTNLVFDIKIPYDVPSDNRQYTINIQESTLPATFEYFCAPKLDREVFLVARITGWEDLNLLSGEINLFFEGTYVGKSTLDTHNTTDTLDLSLGRDKGIVVNRVKMKDFTEQKTIGSNIHETRTWEISVRNTKKLEVNLRLEDQFPVSMNKDIVVDPQEYSGGTYNKETGVVQWRMNLNPADEKKVRLSFGIKYPKDKNLFID